MMRLSIAVVMVLVAACAQDRTDENAAVEETTADQMADTGAAAPAPENMNPGEAVTKQDACAVVSAGDVRDATGVEGEGHASNAGGANTCTWISNAGKAVVLQVYPFASYYEDQRAAYETLYKSKAENVANLGDEAFYIGGTTSGTPTANVVVKKGNSAVGVQIMGGGVGGDLRADAVALAKTALGKI